jgi:hypothetical protein
MITLRHSMLGVGAVLALALIVTGCGSQPPGVTTNPGATTLPPAATTTGEQPTTGPVAGEPCSFLTSEQLAAVVGTAPIEIKERAGRGDCDYWLDAAKTSKVNIGVTMGPDGVTLFDSTKALGEPVAVPSLGDEAYSISLGTDLGTLVMVKQGDAVVAVQVLTTAEPAEQAIRAIALARAVLANL